MLECFAKLPVYYMFYEQNVFKTSMGRNKSAYARSLHCILMSYTSSGLGFSVTVY